MSVSDWVEGARPRTLPAAVVPVAVGAAVAVFGDRHLDAAISQGVLRAALALVVALALQVGVNYANDYSDGIRGTDEVRVGPVRLVGQGLATPKAVRAAAFACFGIAGLAGFALVLLTGAWWLLAVGAAAVASAWFYTGGPRPYGYAGLGEVFVFVFFGLVAVAGTTYVLVAGSPGAGRTCWLGLLMAVPVGLLTCALLVVNNLRDIPGDSAVGKHTLAVRWGDGRTRAFYAACMIVPFVIVGGIAAGAFWWQLPAGAIAGWLALPVAVGALRQVAGGARGPELIPVLGATGRTLLIFGLCAAVGIAIS